MLSLCSRLQILEQAVEDMQKDLVKIRQSYAEVCMCVCVCVYDVCHDMLLAVVVLCCQSKRRDACKTEVIY